MNRGPIRLARRYRQLLRIWRAEGSQGVSQRLRTAAARRLTPKAAVLPVRTADVATADLSRPFRPAAPQVAPGQSLCVNWVTTPAAPGSGGHTTLYRIIRFLAAHGYINRVYFYDVHHTDLRHHESVLRQSYAFDGEVGSVDDGMQDAHAVVATSWATAYPVFNARCTGKRFYFVQDFEPYFYPVGALSALAENTYRMGLHAITAGRWLAEKLRADFSMETDYFDFGCDTSRYARNPNASRAGVTFYARPEAARRGFELGMMALEMFAARQPNIKIHLYGEDLGRLPFACIQHGLVTPDQLNDIYNACYAGLSLSLTNVSLVPHEMLAAGCIPVVNDAVHNRMVLKNPFVRYATLAPPDLASALEAVVTAVNFDSLSYAAAASVQSVSWDDAGSTVDAIFRRTCQSDPRWVEPAVRHSAVSVLGGARE
jgi:hypothetical protein